MTYVCTEKATINEWLKEIEQLKKYIEELKDELDKISVYAPYDEQRKIKRLLINNK